MNSKANQESPTGRQRLLLDAESVASLRGSFPAWTVEGDRLVRTVTFESYLAVLNFLGRMSGVAEQLSHHPDVIWRYTRLDVSITTHDSGGLTQLDVELARCIDELLAS